tara:strand:+ start:155 stop:1075 length:921 start_codon:yes stop_codon:yes gene_type:complete
MPSDVTFVNVRKSFQAVAGLESMTEMDHFFFEQSLNRAVRRAYDSSPVWSRYLVSSEERSLYSLNIVGSNISTVNGNYEILGQDTSGSNVYQQVDSTTFHVYRNPTDPPVWRITSGSTATLASDGTYSVAGGTVRHAENDTEKKANPYQVLVWSNNNSGAFTVSERSLVPFEATNKNSIGQFIRIHRTKAFLENSALEFDYYVDSEGANILNVSSNSQETLFVTYKKAYSATYTETSTDVPSEFFDYIIYTVLSDFYTGDGQTEKALIAEQTATKMLDRELMKLDMFSNRNVITQKFSTYVNRQSR